MRRYYKLTQAVIDSVWTRDGVFTFRVCFDSNGTRKSPRQCPKITIADTAVVSTTNTAAQGCIRDFRIPRGISVRGQRPLPGPVFIDITDTAPVADVDLDQYFV